MGWYRNDTTVYEIIASMGEGICIYFMQRLMHYVVVVIRNGMEQNFTRI